MKFSALRLVALVLLSAAAPAVDQVRDRIVADAVVVPPAALAFDRITHVVQVGGGSRTEIRRVDRWDGKAWTIVSINGKPPTQKDRDSIAKILKAQPVPGYHRLATVLAGATGSRTDAQGRTILTVPKLPPRTVVNDGTDISAHLKAEAVVAVNNGQPFVEELRMSAREPFKMSWVLKVLSFDQVSEYKLDATGRPRLASQSADSQGTMFGMTGGQKSEITYAYR